MNQSKSKDKISSMDVQTLDCLGLWGLVNNAGWATFGEVEWVSIDNYKKAMDINFNGVILGKKL